MRNIFKYVLMELQRRKSRTIINIFGYFLAVASMVILLTIIITSHSAQSAVLEGIGTHFIAYIPEGVAIDYYDINPEDFCCPQAVSEVLLEHADAAIAVKEMPENVGLMFGSIKTQILPAALGDGVTGTIDTIERLPSVLDASPYLLVRIEEKDEGSLVTIGGLGPRMDVKAIHKNVCEPKNVIDGRYLEDTDKGMAMLQESYARYRGLGVGDQVTIKGKSFTVAGIVDPPVRPGSADVYMHIDDAREMLNDYFGAPVLTDQFNIILVESLNVKHHEEAMTSVEELILGGGSGYTFGCWFPAERALDINTNLIWLLVGIIAFGTVVISSKTQYASVIERRHDIGILKIIGWTNKSIIFNIVTESVFQSIVGGILGCIVAVIILLFVPIFELLNIALPGEVIISWIVIVGGLLLALLGGIITGIFPALRAAKQNPADILRRF